MFSVDKSVNKKNKVLNSALSKVLKWENATLTIIMVEKWLRTGESVELTLSYLARLTISKVLGHMNELIGPVRSRDTSTS